MSTLDIRLFGAMEIRHQGALLTDFRSQKALALLAYLICVDRPVTREHLAGLAWPELEQSQALGLLRRTLHDLTSKLPDCLEVDRRTVHFQPLTPVVTDVQTFVTLAAQNDADAWAQAIDLYRAPFLEGVYIDAAPDLESWILRTQEQWQQQMVALLDRLIARHTATAAYHDALRYARRLVALEPWREEAHGQVMLLLARTGQLSAALAQYHTCRQTLWAELAVEPAQSTQALYVRLQSVARRPRHKLPPPTTPFIGREEEVAELLRLLATPHCRLITLLGVGGIGKTRLALAAAQRLVGDNMRMFLHGLLFVSLAGVDTAAQMVATIAQALGLSLQGAATPEATILNHLHDKELLLVLDNVEQLLDEPCLHFLVQVLDGAPEVKLLVTSRTRLGLHSEQLYWLQGLQAPTRADATLTPVTASAYSALRLWIETTRRHDPDYTVTTDDLPALVTITGRYQLHELVRQFAGEHLAIAGAERVTQHRHATALLALIQQIDPPSRYLGARPGLAIITADYENVQAALSWAFAAGEGVLGLTLVAALRDYWYITGNWREGRRWQELALAIPITEGLLAQRAVVLNEWGTLLHVMSETALAGPAYRGESLAIFETLHDRGERAWTLFHLARPEYQQGDNAACDALLFQALTLFRELEDEHGTATVLQRLAMQMMDGAQDLIRAEQFALESLAIARRLDARGTMAGTLIFLGELATRQGQLQQAETYLTECLTLHEPTPAMRAWALGKLGRVLLLNGKAQEAEQIFQEALQIRQEMGSIIGVAWMLECLGEVAVTIGAHAQAVPLFSIAHALRTSRNAPLSTNDGQIFEQLVQKSRTALGEERFITAWHKGECLAQEQTDFAALFGVMLNATRT